ncbi:proline--tRNA ligase [Candidatus Gracilibacteria bacterium]|nr:proline--tRNA ligase [Candidatus Gracilibacteria bacterium]
MSKLTKQTTDFSKWYLELIDLAELADYTATKGAMVIKPYGYRIWELMKENLDKRIKQKGVENTAFPTLIPESFITKEAEHIEGFAPELLTITKVGEKELDEPYVLRPTSETIMYDTFSKWIESYRDLPLKINQWANIFRWEKRTRPFLRTSEFFWQEGHTVHETEQEADEMTIEALEMYDDFAKETMAMVGVKGRKTEAEKFAGAKYTTTIEMIARDGKAIQSCTSHQLGQGFAKSFGIKFVDKNEKMQTPWQTSWGLSTRMLGAMIVCHGDDKGLRLPPKIAPYQVVIIPIGKDDKIFDEAKKIDSELKNLGIRTKIDARQKSPGFRIAEWEVKGAPIRIEMGMRDLENNQLTLARRDTDEKFTIKIDELSKISEILEEIHNGLLTQHEEFLAQNTREVFDYDTFKEIIENKNQEYGKVGGGFVKAGWCGNEECEEKIQSETKASSRCIPFSDENRAPGDCVYCGKPAEKIVVFAKAY